LTESASHALLLLPAPPPPPLPAAATVRRPLWARESTRPWTTVTQKAFPTSESTVTRSSSTGSRKLSPTVHIAPASFGLTLPSGSTTCDGSPRFGFTRLMMTASPGSGAS
jgi:hypothetical protein